MLYLKRLSKVFKMFLFVRLLQRIKKLLNFFLTPDLVDNLSKTFTINYLNTGQLRNSFKQGSL